VGYSRGSANRFSYASKTQIQTSTNHHLSSKKTAITIATPLQHERRRQIRGLLLLAFAVLAISILHTGIHNVFHPGWWHPW